MGISCAKMREKKLTLIRVELSEAQQISDIHQIVCVLVDELFMIIFMLDFRLMLLMLLLALILNEMY